MKERENSGWQRTVDAEREAHVNAIHSLGLSGQTGQRVRSTAPPTEDRAGVIVRWEEEYYRRTAVVRWDDGEESRQAPELLCLA